MTSSSLPLSSRCSSRDPAVGNIMNQNWSFQKLNTEIIIPTLNVDARYTKKDNEEPQKM